MTPEERFKLHRALLARETGWTFQHIEEEMDHTEIDETLEIYDAVDRGQGFLRERAQNAAARNRSRAKRG